MTNDRNDHRSDQREGQAQGPQRQENQFIKDLWNTLGGGWVMPGLENRLGRFLTESEFGKAAFAFFLEHEQPTRGGAGVAAAWLKRFQSDPTMTTITDILGELTTEGIRVFSAAKQDGSFVAIKAAAEKTASLLQRLIMLGEAGDDLSRWFLYRLEIESRQKAISLIAPLDNKALKEFSKKTDEAKWDICSVFVPPTPETQPPREPSAAVLASQARLRNALVIYQDRKIEQPRQRSGPGFFERLLSRLPWKKEVNNNE